MKILDLLRINLLFCVTLVIFKSADASVAAGYITGMRPLVQHSSGKGKIWRTATVREVINYGDIVRASDKGKANILLNNGDQLTLSPNMQLEFVTPPGNDRPPILRFFGGIGRLFVRANAPVVIRSAAGTAANTGTVFSIDIDSDERTTVTVVEGHVNFSNQGVTEPVNPGEASTSTPTTAPTKAVQVDTQGIFNWIADVKGLPLTFEWPFARPRNDGEKLFNQHRYNEAVSFLEKLVSASSSASDLAALGRAQLFEGDTASAANSYAQALTRNPPVGIRNDAALAKSLILLAQEGDRNLSGIDSEKAIDGDVLGEKVPEAANSPLFPAVQALADLQTGKSKAAIQHLIGQNGFQAKTLLALALIQENELAAAQATARQAVQLEPGSASAHAVLSMAAFFQGDMKLASSEAEEGRKVDAFSPLVLLASGRASLALGNTDDARSDIARAASLAPELPLLQIELGGIETRLDHLPRAEKAFRHALEKAPNDARALSGLATVLALQDRKPEALNLFAKALAINPNDPNIRAQYAEFLVRNGDLKGARATAEELLATQKADTPAVGALLIRLSEASLFQQQIPDAFDFAQRAVNLLPRSAWAHYQWGRVYFEQGRTVQAQNQFRIATQLDQELARARYALGLTQEIRSSGRDISSPIGQAAAAVESSQSASIIRDLLTPGATERVQASVQDPTVARTATRSYGNYQLDGLFGTKSFAQGSLSALLPSADERRLFGFNAEHFDYDGPRANSGDRLNRGELLFGRKAEGGPSGFWGLAQTQKSNPGQNFGFFSDSYNAGLDTTRKLSTGLLGYNLQSKESQRTRFLVGVDRLEQDASDAFNGAFDRRVRSFHGEVRHDLQLNAHRFSVGLSAGRRSFDTNDFLPAPPPFPSLTTISNQDYNAYTVYLRDVWQPSAAWRLTGELKGVRLQRQLNRSTQPNSPALPGVADDESRSRLLPNLIVEHYLNDRTNVRFRARQVLGSFTDFDLLAPTDVFLFAASEDYLPNLGRRANAYDFEVDHTFKNGGFARIGAFRRSIDGGTLKSTGLNYDSSRINGLTFGYEGLLNRQTSYFFNTQLLDGRGNRLDVGTGTGFGNERISGTPRFQAEVGTQYLADNGFFVQPSIAYLGERDIYRASGAGFTRDTQDSSVLANLRVGQRWGLRSVVYGEVVNLFNQNYSTGSDYNERRAIGRQFRLGASFRF